MNTDKRRTFRLISIIPLFLCVVLVLSLSACATLGSRPTNVKMLIVPKFEIDEMSGDYPGEAQLFYEKYCPGEKPVDIVHLPDATQFYLNEKSGVAILITGSGKTAAALAMTVVLNAPDLDFSDAYIVSVGCSGGSYECTTLGDVVLVTAACDNELGHTADIREFSDPNAEVTWFYDNSYDTTAYKHLDASLAERIYEFTKEVPLQTTAQSQNVLKTNFPGEDWRLRAPKVLKGTALTGDSYWKGIYGHKNALKIIDTFGCPDPYAVTEMEELTMANVAACYGMLDRLISFRVVVDLDIFIGEDRPETLWSGKTGYNESVEALSGEDIDIFETGMQNLFDVASVAIDAVLNQ